MAEYVTDADMAPPLMSPEGKSEGVGVGVVVLSLSINLSGSESKRRI